MEAESDQLFRLWRVRRTLMQMCNDRGYDVPEDQLDITLDAFKEQFGDDPA